MARPDGTGGPALKSSTTSQANVKPTPLFSSISVCMSACRVAGAGRFASPSVRGTMHACRPTFAEGDRQLEKWAFRTFPVVWHARRRAWIADCRR